MTDLRGTPSEPGDDELTELRALAGRVRPETIAWETPPTDLWDRIAAGAELIDGGDTLDPPVTPGDDGAGPLADARHGADPPVEHQATPTSGSGGSVVAQGDAGSPVATPDESTDDGPAAPPVPAPAPPPDGGPGATVHPLGSARRARTGGARRGPARPWLAAIAAAVVLLVGAGALVTSLSASDDPTVVAASALERLAGDSGEGRAELLDRDGSLELQVDTAGLDAGDGFLEVWVIDPDVTKLVSLGPLRADGRYDLPAGLDPEEFPIVDVSVEPIDGNPAHSGDSVLRGELRF